MRKVEAVGGIRAVKSLVGRDLAQRIDIQHPGRSGICLGHAQGGVQRQKLPVDVGGADGVVVDEIQGANAAAGQGFYHIAAHAAQTEHGHPDIFQFFHGIAAQKQLGSGKGFHSAPSLFFLYPTTVCCLCREGRFLDEQPGALYDIRYIMCVGGKKYAF